MAVAAPADRGRANQALVELICEELSLKHSQVSLMTGATNRDKKLLIRGLNEVELTDRLARVLEEPKNE